MSIENAVYADLRTSIARVWPEVGVAWETDQAERLPFESFTLPFAVIALSDFPEAPDEGSVDCTSYLPAPEIYYVAATTGPLNFLRDKLSALKDDLMSNTFSTIEVLNCYDLQYGKSLSGSDVFVQKRSPDTVGKITARCLISESY